jgi:hypothetical protein
MDTTQTYLAIRSEIMTNHVLLHWFTLIVALSIVMGTVLIERLGKTILSIFLPLLSLAWAASVLRFDFFIHRQAAYLRLLEERTPNALPMWETWKAGLRSTALVVPFADIIVSAVIVVPTIYLLFGPAQTYLTSRSSNWGRAYALGVSTILILVLLSLAVVPKLALY